MKWIETEKMRVNQNSNPLGYELVVLKLGVYNGKIKFHV